MGSFYTTFSDFIFHESVLLVTCRVLNSNKSIDILARYDDVSSGMFQFESGLVY